MNRIGRLRTLHHAVSLFAAVSLGPGCFLIYGFDAEPPVACTQTSDCPGSDRCGQRTCKQGACEFLSFTGGGVVLENEPRGNCQRVYCDGQGNEVVEVDETDVPNDGNPCTEDVCEGGVPVNRFKPVGTPCGTISTVTCDEMGACIGCMDAGDCGVDTACSTWSCEGATCERLLQPPGTVVDNPTAGDCSAILCDTIGESSPGVLPEDAPSDGDSCTTDLCTLQGTVEHQVRPDGAQCGDCQACMEGACAPCDSSTSDCYNGECIAKPQACVNPADCPSGYCVDGYCCDAECASPCMACSNEKTGQPSGLCLPVLDGTDPDDDCTDPMTDICFAGNCQCHNGKQDAAETGVDCGGNCSICTGKWNCSGCVPITPQVCCNFTCFDCPNQLSQCEAIEGKTCPLGAQKQTFSLGVVNAINCFPNSACRVAECNCQP